MPFTILVTNTARKSRSKSQKKGQTTSDYSVKQVKVKSKRQSDPEMEDEDHIFNILEGPMTRNREEEYMRIHELLEDFAREYEWFYSLYIPLLLSYRNQNKKMKKISKNHFSLHLSTVLQIKNILYPDAFDDLALEGAKLSPSLYDVLAPLSEHCLTVWECQQTLAMFFVRFECALERLPFFADITEIPIVKTTNYRLRMLIIKNTSTVEIASFPLSSIIRSTWRIVQWSYTFDLVLDPVALVEHSIRIDEHSFPMLFTP